MAENLTGMLLPWKEIVPRDQIPGKELGPSGSRSAGLVGFALDLFGSGAAVESIFLDFLRFFLDDGEESPSSSQELAVAILLRMSIIITVHGERSIRFHSETYGRCNVTKHARSRACSSVRRVKWKPPLPP